MTLGWATGKSRQEAPSVHTVPAVATEALCPSVHLEGQQCGLASSGEAVIGPRLGVEGRV